MTDAEVFAQVDDEAVAGMRKRDEAVWKDKADGDVWGALTVLYGKDAITDRATLLVVCDALKARAEQAEREIAERGLRTHSTYEMCEVCHRKFTSGQCNYPADSTHAQGALYARCPIRAQAQEKQS